MTKVYYAIHDAIRWQMLISLRKNWHKNPRNCWAWIQHFLLSTVKENPIMCPLFSCKGGLQPLVKVFPPLVKKNNDSARTWQVLGGAGAGNVWLLVKWYAFKLKYRVSCTIRTIVCVVAQIHVLRTTYSCCKDHLSFCGFIRTTKGWEL